MDRQDLERVLQANPQVPATWRRRRKILERQRDARVRDLDGRFAGRYAGNEPNVPALYNDINRLDRTIAFIDRALLHIDDIAHGTEHAAQVPLRPT